MRKDNDGLERAASRGGVCSKGQSGVRPKDERQGGHALVADEQKYMIVHVQRTFQMCTANIRS